MTRAAWQEVVRGVAAACEPAGFDIVHPFNLADCDWAELSRGHAAPSAFRPRALGILIGNTRRLWPHFMEAVAGSAALASAAHPLDTYVSQHLSRSVRPGDALIFAHVTVPTPFPIQRLAEQVGLAALSPSHLAVHPRHGPWVALRAVVVADVDGPASPAHERVRVCDGCLAPCVPALERAIAASGAPLDVKAISAHANDWIAVRDACPIGRESRYGEAQLDYHYSRANRRLTQGS